jgi:protein TonB
VKSPELFSKAWCDLVFSGRNKEYGAYRIRQRAGRRNRFAVIVVALLALFLSVLPILCHLYLRYRLYQGFKDVETEVRQLKRLEKEKDIEMKQLSAGRGAPVESTVKDAHNETPQIVEEDERRQPVFGVDGPETYIVDDHLLFEDRDTLHNRHRKDLPIEGPQLVKTEVVEVIPQYPGGPTALMAWLDANIAYPRRSIEKKVEGDMEVMFYVNEKGNVVDPKVTTSLAPELDAAVLRALRRMPRWVPGRKEGKPTTVCITLPIHFQIQ